VSLGETAATRPERSIVLAAQAMGAWATNGIVIGDRASGAAVIIDPGQHAEAPLTEMLAALGLVPVAILLTHGHLDHLWSAPALARRYDVPVHLHPGDRWLWDSPPAAFGEHGAAMAQGYGFGPWEVDGIELRELADAQRMSLAGLRFDVRHTPGHTPGHVTFLTDDLRGAALSLEGRQLDAPGPVLIAGDLLFAGSIGRTDLAGGDAVAMHDSLGRTMAGCTDETLVIPGHGPATSIGEERRHNPFLTDLTTRSNDASR
jgi:glyoxylase-like metal-dependent hydrolase (beta-lactamase superfamily II)